MPSPVGGLKATSSWAGPRLPGLKPSVVVAPIRSIDAESGPSVPLPVTLVSSASPVPDAVTSRCTLSRVTGPIVTWTPMVVPIPALPPI